MPVDLPKTSAQQVGGKDEPMVVSVNSQGEVFLGETKYDLPELATKLKAVHEEKPDQRVFMRGDKAVDYGKMMEVMGVVIDSGFRQSASWASRRSSSARAPAAPCRLHPARAGTTWPAAAAAADAASVDRKKERRGDRWTTASSAVPGKHRDAHAGHRVGDAACRLLGRR